MEMAYKILVIVQVLCALGIIALVLLQHGKGADMGAAFGSGSAGSLFGATGSANFLSRTTGILAALFMVMTLGLAYIATHAGKPALGEGVMDKAPPKSAPATTGAPMGVPGQVVPGAATTAPAPATGSAAVPVPGGTAPAPAAVPAAAPVAVPAGAAPAAPAAPTAPAPAAGEKK